MQRDDLGKFVLKNGEHRSVRSLRLTDTTWTALGELAETLSLTRADLLEQIFRSKPYSLPRNTRMDEELPPCITWQEADSQPSNTWINEQTERLEAEVAKLREENTNLLEKVQKLSQGKDLEVVRERVLSSLKLGKQAPGYKTALSALNQFIKLLRSSV